MHICMYAAHMFVQDSEYMCVRLEFEVRMFDVLHYSSVLLYFDFFYILKLCCITSLLPTLPRTSPHSFTNSWPLFSLPLLNSYMYTHTHVNSYIHIYNLLTMMRPQTYTKIYFIFLRHGYLIKPLINLDSLSSQLTPGIPFPCLKAA